MAWTVPMTAVPGTIFTAAQWNMFIRDNLNETCPAKATQESRYFVTAGPNEIAQRGTTQDIVGDTDSTTDQSYSDLATPGPQVPITTGIRAMVFIRVQVANTTVGARSWASVEIEGATEVQAFDNHAAMLQTAVANQEAHVTAVNRLTVNPGENIFTMKYRCGAGTATYRRRRLFVMAL